MGIITFVLGAALASFISLIADRYNTGRSSVRGRSICFSCGETLGVGDLIPIFSYLYSRGRCRSCNSRIPATLLWVELLMGSLSVLAAYQVGLLYNLSTLLIIQFLLFILGFCALLLITLYDLKHKIIPDSFLLAFLVVGVIKAYIAGALLSGLLYGLIIALPFFLIWLLSKGALMGLGDPKMMFAMAFFLGGLPVISAVFLAFWLGAVVIIVLKVFGRRLTMKSEIPFAPFLAVSTVLTALLDINLFHVVF